MKIVDLSPSDLGELDIARYKVEYRYLNAFRRPNTVSGKVKELHRGEEFYGLYQVKGEPIEDIPIWIAHIKGGFIWIGGLQLIKFDPALDNLILPWYPNFYS